MQLSKLENIHCLQVETGCVGTRMEINTPNFGENNMADFRGGSETSQMWLKVFRLFVASPLFTKTAIFGTEFYFTCISY